MKLMIEYQEIDRKELPRDPSFTGEHPNGRIYSRGLDDAALLSDVAVKHRETAIRGERVRPITNNAALTVVI